MCFFYCGFDTIGALAPYYSNHRCYYLPIQSTYLQGLTIFGNVNNLFTVTRYLGSDPDCAMASGILTQGIDCGLLGKGRSFSLGVNINL